MRAFLKLGQVRLTIWSMRKVLRQHISCSFFDAVIIAVARRAGATLLLSEDMHDGLVIEGLTIVNPFVAGNEGVLADWLGSAF